MRTNLTTNLGQDQNELAVKGKTRHRSSSVQRLIDDIVGDINSGTLKTGEYLPTGQELADKYGVGYASVIRVFKTLKEQGLVETIQGRGAFVNGVSIPAGRLDEVAVVLPSYDTLSEISNPFSDWVFRKLLAGINGATLERQMRLHLLFSDEVGKQYREIVDSLDDGSGIIFVLDAPPNWVIRAQRRRIPYALVLPMAITGWEMELPRAYCDYHTGVYMAVAELIKKGRRRPVFLGDPNNMHEASRYRGFTDALAEAGLEEESLILCSEISRDAGKNAVEEYLSTRPLSSFDLLVAGNDRRALGALRVLRGRGVRVPDDIAVLGFDDIPESVEAGLSTVRLPIRELGEQTGQWFLDSAVNFMSEADPPCLEVPCPVVWRHTT